MGMDFTAFIAHRLDVSKIYDFSEELTTDALSLPNILDDFGDYKI